MNEFLNPKTSYGNEINISYTLRYKSADEIVGHHVYLKFKNPYYYYGLKNCRDYYDYLEYSLYYVTILVHYWSLNISKIKKSISIK